MSRNLTGICVSRRKLLAAGAAGAIVALGHEFVPQRGLHHAIEDASPPDANGHDGHGHSTTQSSAGIHCHTGALADREVDHRANGFDPREMVRDFDWGRERRLPSGRRLREWELVATDKEIEVTPGVKYAAWVYNGRVPGPALRCREGERLRIRDRFSGSGAGNMRVVPSSKRIGV